MKLERHAVDDFVMALYTAPCIEGTGSREAW